MFVILEDSYKKRNKEYYLVLVNPNKILQLAAALHGCSTAICDKVKQSAESGIQAVVEFITKRGNELNETDISRSFSHEYFVNFVDDPQPCFLPSS